MYKGRRRGSQASGMAWEERASWLSKQTTYLPSAFFVVAVFAGNWMVSTFTEIEPSCPSPLSQMSISSGNNLTDTLRNHAEKPFRYPSMQSSWYLVLTITLSFSLLRVTWIAQNYECNSSCRTTSWNRKRREIWTLVPLGGNTS